MRPAKSIAAALLSVLIICVVAPCCTGQTDVAGLDGLLLPIPKGSKWGYRDRSGRWAIKPQFQMANPFVEGMAEVWANNKKFYIDSAGRRIEDRNFASDHFSEGLIPINVGEKYGFADRDGNVVIFPRFDGASDFSEGLAPVEVGDKWGYIDRAGRVVIAAQFDGADSFSEGLAAVCLYEGKPPETPPGQTLGDEAFDWYFMKGPKKKCGYVDRAGARVVAPQYGEAGSFSEGLAPVCVGRCQSVRSIIPHDKEGDAREWGYVDKTGRIAIAPQFNHAESFAEGLAVVRVGNKFGYINASGKFVIPPRFASAENFTGGLALVGVGEWRSYWPYRGVTVISIWLQGKWGYVDKTGGFVSDKLSWKDSKKH